MLNTFKPKWSEEKTLDKAAYDIIHGLNVEQYKAYVPQFLRLHHIGEELANSTLTVLDFGCGLGRFCYHAGNRYPNWKIVGYDCPEMVRNAQRLWTLPPNVELSTSWDDILSRKFELINAEIVLMHVLEPAVREYLRQFKQLLEPGALGFFHATRETLDDEVTNIWDIVFSEGWDVVQKYYGEFKTNDILANAAALLRPKE